MSNPNWKHKLAIWFLLIADLINHFSRASLISVSSISIVLRMAAKSSSAAASSSIRSGTGGKKLSLVPPPASLSLDSPASLRLTLPPRLCPDSPALLPLWKSRISSLVQQNIFITLHACCHLIWTFQLAVGANPVPPVLKRSVASLLMEGPYIKDCYCTSILKSRSCC